MVENLNEQKSSVVVNKKPQKIKNRKKLLLRLIAVICAVGLAVGVTFLVNYLIQLQRDSADIKIGDTRISKKQIEDAQKQAEEYKKENPDAVINDKVVKDMLIMNVALKQKAKEKCGGIKLTSREIYNIAQNQNIQDDNDVAIKSFLGDEGGFYYINQENYAYQKKMESCLIRTRKIFRVSINYESEYFSSGNDSERKAKYEQAKNVLRDKFLPMFKNKESAEKIASNTDINLIDSSITAEEYNKINQGILTIANLDELNGVSASAGYNPAHNDGNDLIGKTSNIEERTAKMKSGEYSDVLTTGVGVFAIVRVENDNGNEYYNWSELLNEIKKKNNILDENSDKASAVVGSMSGRVCFAVNDDTWTCQGPGNGHWISKPGFSSSFNNILPSGHPGDYRHLKALIIRVKDGTIAKNGVRVTSRANGISSSDVTSHVTYGGVWNSKQGVPEGDGIAFALGDCVGGGTITATIHVPSGYQLVSHSPTYNVGIGNANALGFKYEEVQIRKKEREKRQVRQNYPSNANTSAQADTRVAVRENGNSSPIAQNSSEWRTGTLVAPVGSHVSFKHEVTGNASSNNNQGSVSVDWNTSGQNKSGLATNGGGNLGSRFNGLAVRQGNTTETKNNNWSSNSSFRVSNADVGKIICDNIRGTITQNPKTRVVTYQVYVDNGQEVPGTKREYFENEPAQSRTATSNQSCVYVPYEFELVPCIKAGNANCGGTDIPVEPGTNTPVVPRITGTGTPTPPNSRWIITRWKIPGNFEGNPETPKDRRDNNNGNTCSHYNNEFGGHAKECNSGQTGTGSFTGNPPTVINTGDIGVPNDAELGARYCIGLSVSPYKMERNESQAAQNAKVGRDWRHSAPICVLVTKKPKMQVWSNGVYSRGGIKTSRSEIGGNSFGSWVEFEAIGGRTITGFRTESSQNTSNLTFRNGIANSTGRNSNATDRGNWGQWGSSNNVNHLIESLKARYPKSDASRNVHVEGNSNLNANIGGFTNTGTRIYYAKDATITGNIINSEPRSNGGNFAQTIIIANNINISKDVTRVDAWLIASNDINTCPVGKKNVNESNCGKQLTVNGPLIARSLNSWRTAGSTPTDRKSPAEIYNQRADVYLWAYGQSGGVGRIITTYTKELPVRY